MSEPARDAQALNTHGVRMANGRHRGERITRVPVSYLKWMVNEGHQQADLAAAELSRRGTVTPDLDISGHAIDRASLRCMKVYRRTRRKEEGLHAWLVRNAAEALETPEIAPDKHAHLGLVWVFHKGGVWPVLKTLLRHDGGP